jgi:hypothetical protein
MRELLNVPVFPYQYNNDDLLKELQKQAGELLEIRMPHLNYDDQSYIVQRND